MTASKNQNFKVRMGSTNCAGTGLVGTIKIFYNDLSRIFSKPQKFGSPDNKVQVEWYY